jgi:hypothetical protein
VLIVLCAKLLLEVVYVGSVLESRSVEDLVFKCFAFRHQTAGGVITATAFKSIDGSLVCAKLLRGRRRPDSIFWNSRDSKAQCMYLI